MERPLKGFRAPALRPKGLSLEPWCGNRLWEFAEVSRLSFAGEPDVELFPCFASREGCLRLMIDLSTRLGFLPDATLLARVGPEAVGTIHGVMDQEGLAWVWNLGVIPGWRGKGIAGSLLSAVMRTLRSRRVERLALEVTADNVAALALYRRFGFRRTRTVYREKATESPAEF